MAEESFGQTVVLTKRIASVLRGYPEGPASLNELLQNADDAGATSVALCLDMRQHPRDGLRYPGLADFQGPALLAYNSAVFTDEDFASIVRIGDSKKQGKRTKVGRFGVGFNSVYHTTDVPSFISGPYIVFFDPHMSNLGLQAGSDPGRRINFTSREGKAMVAKHPNTLVPYEGVYGCTKAHSFKGTLFRFPLRTAAQAARSEISRSKHTAESMLELLRAFRTNVDQTLIFLRHVESVQVHIWASDAPKMQLWFEARVTGATAAQRRTRDLLGRIPPALADISDRKTCQETTVLTVAFSEAPLPAALAALTPGPATSASSDADASEASEATATTVSGRPPAVRSWLLVQGVGTGRSLAIARDPETKANDLALVPFAGLAVPLADSGTASAAGSVGLPLPLDGRAYVFLPLSMATRLPFHTNGYFEVSENRRDIWFGPDMTGGARLRSDWNVALLEDALPDLFGLALRTLAPALERNGALSAGNALMPDAGAAAAFFALWPEADVSSPPWSLLTAAIYRQALSHPWLPVAGHGWQRAGACTLLVPESDNDRAVARVLCSAGAALQLVPPHVAKGLRQAAPRLPWLTPVVARRMWRECRAATTGKAQLTPAPEDALAMLRYLLSDGCNLAALDSLPVLPLASGRVVAPCSPAMQAVETIFLCGPELHALLSPATERLLHPALLADEGLIAYLTDPEMLNGTQLRVPSVRDIAALLEDGGILPRAWAQPVSGRPVPHAQWHGDAGITIAGIAGQVWLANFWALLPTLAARDDADGCGAGAGSGTDRSAAAASATAALARVPLVPVSDGTLVAPGDDTAAILLSSELLPPAVAQALHAAGAQSVKPPSGSTLDERFLRACACVCPSTPEGSVDTLYRIVQGRVRAGEASQARTETRSVAVDLLEGVSAYQREALLRYICPAVAQSAAADARRKLATLPLFAVCGHDSSVDPSATSLPAATTATAEETSGGSGSTVAGPAADSQSAEPPAAAAFVALGAVGEHLLAPNDVLTADRGVLPRTFLALPPRCTDVRAVAKALGASVVSPGALVEEHVLPRGSLVTAERYLVWVQALLANLPGLLPQDASEAARDRAHLAQLAFVPDGSGLLQPPDHLYDPGVHEIAGIVDEAAAYPASALQAQPACLDSLRQLGLQTTVLPRGLVVLAERIAAMDDKDRAKKERGQRLLAFIDRRDAALFPATPRVTAVFSSLRAAITRRSPREGDGEAGGAVLDRPAFYTLLRDLAWLPVQQQPPEPALPWPADVPTLAAPARVCLPRHAWLASSQRFLLDVTASVSDGTLEALGLLDAPPAAVVAQQLLACSAQWRATVSRGDAQAQAQLRAALNANCGALYALLGQGLEGGGEAAKATVALRTEPCVWVGTTFCRPQEVAFASVVDLRPMFHTMERGLAADHATLFRALGVMRTFSPSALLSYLAALAEEVHDDTAEAKEQSQGQSADEQSKNQTTTTTTTVPLLNVVQLQTVSALAQELARTRETWSDSGQQLYLPDKQGRMRLAASLVYNDSSWAPPMQHDLVHAHIAPAIAQRLGVRSLVQLALGADTAEDTVYEPYGQAESLTTRLKGLLEVYPDGPSIFKELAQNADDAGAEELEITYSERTFESVSLVDDNMAEWQGPALYVYNSAPFREQDFQNLARLAQSEKKDDPAASGRFGVGWNSVYHFTDVPSIFSGEHLAILDPHRHYLPASVCGLRPGLRVKWRGLCERFPDQVAPYLAYSADTVRDGFPGTLFRFPLRTPAAAARSEIKPGQVYTGQNVYTLLMAFRPHLQDLLLFLHTLRRVRVLFEAADGTRSVLFEAEAASETGLAKNGRGNGSLSGSSVPRPLAEALQQKPATLSRLPARSPRALPTRVVWSALLREAKLAGYGHADLVAALSAAGPLYEVALRRLSFTQSAKDQLPSAWTALAPLDSRSESKAAGTEGTEGTEGATHATADESGTIAAEPGAAAETLWLVVAATGLGASAQRAADPKLAHLRLLPWSGVAVPLLPGATGPAVLPGAARVFVTLPLPIHPPLPLHLNGQFEISSNRRDLWSGSDMTGDGRARSSWNETLLADATASAYVHALTLLGSVLREEAPLTAVRPAVKERSGADDGATIMPEASVLEESQPALQRWWALLPGASGMSAPWHHLTRAVTTHAMAELSVPQARATTARDAPRIVWDACSAAFFLPPSAAVSGTLWNALACAGVPMACCTAAATTALLAGLGVDAAALNQSSYDTEDMDEDGMNTPPLPLRLATPATVRRLLRVGKTITPGISAPAPSSPVAAVMHLEWLSDADLAAVLAWIVSDLDPADAATLSLLNDLPLVPLEDGRMGYLRAQGPAFFGSTEHSRIDEIFLLTAARARDVLLPHASSTLVRMAVLTGAVGAFFERLAADEHTNVSPLRPALLHIPLTRCVTPARPPTDEWLVRLWEALGHEAGMLAADDAEWRMALAQCGDLPLVFWRTDNGSKGNAPALPAAAAAAAAALRRPYTLVALGDTSSPILQRSSPSGGGDEDGSDSSRGVQADSLPSELLAVLHKLGVRLLPSELLLPAGVLRTSPALHSANTAGVAGAVLGAALESTSANPATTANAGNSAAAEARRAEAWFLQRQIKASERRCLAHFLAADARAFASEQPAQVLRRLPLFEVGQGTGGGRSRTAGRDNTEQESKEQDKDKDAALSIFVAPEAREDELCLPPALYHRVAWSFSGRFVVDDALEPLCSVIGIRPLPETSFVIEHLLSCFEGATEENQMDGARLILERWPTLKGSNPGLSAVLRSVAWVPDGRGRLCEPRYLHEVRVAAAAALVGPDAAFPHPALQQPALLDALYSLGVARSVGPEVVLRAAQRLTDAAAKAKTELTSSETVGLLAAVDARKPSVTVARSVRSAASLAVQDVPRSSPAIMASVPGPSPAASSTRSTGLTSVAPASLSNPVTTPPASPATAPTMAPTTAAQAASSATLPADPVADRNSDEAGDLRVCAEVLLRTLSEDFPRIDAEARAQGLAETLRSALLGAPYIPIRREPPPWGPLPLPWQGMTTASYAAGSSVLSGFAAPEACRPPADALVVGGGYLVSGCRVVDELAEVFGWNRPPPASRLLAQLAALLEVWHDASAEQRAAPGAAWVMGRACRGVYDALDRLCDAGAVTASERSMLGHAGVAGSCPTVGTLGAWFWADVGFTSVLGVVRGTDSVGSSLRPYLWTCSELDAAAERVLAAGIDRALMQCHMLPEPVALDDCSAFLDLCGVPDAVGATQLAFALRMMALAAAAETPIIPGVPAAAAAARATEAERATVTVRTAADGTADLATGLGLPAAASAAAASAATAAVSPYDAATSAHLAVANNSESIDASPPLSPPTLALALSATQRLAHDVMASVVLRQQLVLLPTHTGRLAQASRLIYHVQTSAVAADDRSSAAEAEQLGAVHGNLFFLHPDLSVDDAAALGVPSLQDFLNADDEHSETLGCPSTADLAPVLRLAQAVASCSIPVSRHAEAGNGDGDIERGAAGSAADAGADDPAEMPDGAGPAVDELGEDGEQATSGPALAAWVVRQVLEVADLLGCQRATVSMDARRHPTRQLLRQELAPLQEPALVIQLHGLVLRPRDVAALLCGTDGDTPLVERQPQGVGWPALFALTDTPCVLSGTHLCFLDAQRDTLATLVDDGSGSNSSSTAGGLGKAYNFAQSALMLTHFRDQFRPFAHCGLEAPQGSDGVVEPVNATVLRLPLRTLQSTLAGFPTLTCQPAAVALSVKALLPLAVPLLLAHVHLEELSVTDFQLADADAAAGDPVWSVVVNAPHTQRRAVLGLRTWQGTWSLFKTTYAPQTVSFTASAAVHVQGALHSSEQWYVYHALANSEARALAHTPLLARRGLMPYVGVAIRWADAPAHAAASASARRRRPLEGAAGLHINADGAVAATPLPVTTLGSFLASGWGLISHMTVPVEDCGSQQVLGCTVQLPGEVVAQWNTHLSASLAECYVEALAVLAIRVRVGEGDLVRFYRRFPGLSLRTDRSGDAVQAIAPLVHAFYAKAQQSRLFFRPSGMRVKMGDGMVLTDRVTPELRSYITHAFPDCLEMPLTVAKRLSDANSTDEKKFFQQRPKIKTLTPLRLAQQIKSTVRTPEQFPEADKPVEVRVRLAGEMLAYCSQEANALAALGQSPIVPLESGSFVPLDDREVVIGTQEEQSLVGGTHCRWLHHAAAAVLQSKPRVTDALSGRGMRLFDMAALDTHLSTVLPPAWRRKTAVPWTGSPGAADSSTAAGLSEDWLRSLWRYLTRLPTEVELDRHAAQVARLPLPAQHRHVITQRLAAVSHWPLLPIADGTLLSLAHRHSALILAGDTATLPADVQVAVAALRQLGVPCLREGYDELCTAALGGLAPDPADAEQALLWPSYLAEKAYHAARGGLLPNSGPASGVQARRSDACAQLYEFFRSHAAELDDSVTVLDGVRALPIFPPIDPVALRHPLQPNTQTFDVSVAGSVLPPQPEEYVAFDSDASELYRVLQVTVPDPALAMEMHVLPRLASMTPEEVHDVLAKIASDDRLEPVVESLVPMLEHIPCIRTLDGSLQPPATVVDVDGHPLLATIFGDHLDVVLAKDNYTGQGWMSLLHKLGVCHKVTAAVFMRCAEAVADRWQSVQQAPVAVTPPDDTALDAEGQGVAVDAEAAAAEAEPEGLSAESVLAQGAAVMDHLHQHCASIFNSHVARRGALMAHLATLSVVPVEHESTAEKALVPLERCAAPVDRCLVGLCRPCPRSAHLPPESHWRQLGLVSPPPPDAVLETLQRLPAAVADPASWPLADVQPLMVTAAVLGHLAPLYDTLASALQTQLRAAPLVAVGRTVLPARCLFFKLSAPLAPYALEVPAILRRHEPLLYKLGVRDRPTPAALVVLLQQACTARQGQELDPSALQGALRTLEYLRQLQPKAVRGTRGLGLPTADNRMEPIENCVYCDEPALLGRVDMSKVSLTLASPLISHEMAAACNLRALSAVVELRWRARPRETVVDVDSGAGAGAGGNLTTLSDHMLALLARISQEHHGGQVPEKVVQNLGMLKGATIRRAESLSLECVYKDTQADVTHRDASFQHYFDRHAQELWLTTSLPAGLTSTDVLAAALSQLLAPGHSLALAPLLLVPEEEADAAAAQLGLLSRQHHNTGRGVPGQLILPRDRSILQLPRRHAFFPGEVVAVQPAEADHDFSGPWVYAHVEELSTDDDSSAAVSGDVFQLPTVEQLVVRVGGGHLRTVLVSAVRIFVPVADSADRTRAARFHVPEAEATDSTVDVPDTAEGVPAEEGGRQKAKFLAAVQDLLRQAGLPPQPDVMEQMGRVISLQRELQETRVQLRDEQARAVELRRHAENLEVASECGICRLGREDGTSVDVVLVPCGHVFCGDCAHRLQRCAECRQNITARQRFFR